MSSVCVNYLTCFSVVLTLKIATETADDHRSVSPLPPFGKDGFLRFGIEFRNL